MIIISIMIMVMVMGYVLLALTYMIPLFRLIYMDWIAAIVISIPTFMMIIRLGTSKSLRIFERKPVGKELTIFLRRDGTVSPMYMNRPFKSMSFLESKDMGLIHDLGKGSVYRWGDKNVRFVLENVAHTPDPRFVSFCDWLYKLGFNNMAELQAAVSGENGSEVIEKIVPFSPVDKFIDEVKEVEESKSFKPVTSGFHDKVDKAIVRWKNK